MPLASGARVYNRTPSSQDGLQVALESKRLLDNNGTPDAHRDTREAKRLGSASPKLMKPVLPSNPTADLQVSLTNTLGTSISTKNHAYTEGAFGFYVSSDNKLFGVTARNVNISPNWVENEKYEFKFASQPRQAVALPGDAT